MAPRSVFSAVYLPAEDEVEKQGYQCRREYRDQEAWSGEDQRNSCIMEIFRGTSEQGLSYAGGINSSDVKME